MLRVLLFFLSFSALAAPRAYIPPGGFQDNFWQQVQIQHLQTQQQLQYQDQYRRMLLMQDQERQLQQLMDRQDDMEFFQRNQIMHEHSDRLRLYTQPLRTAPKPAKNKAGK